MGRSFTQRVNDGKRQRHRLSNDGARRSNDGPGRSGADTGSNLPPKGPLIDLTNDTGSEVSIDETLSQFSRQPSAVFSDIDLSSFQGARSEANSPPTSRNAVLLDRERTINALRHRLEEKDNIILTLQAEQDTLKAENKSLQGRMQSQEGTEELHETGGDESDHTIEGTQERAGKSAAIGLPSSKEGSPSRSLHLNASGLEPYSVKAKGLGQWVPQILGLAWIGTTGILTAYIYHLRAKR